MVEKSSSASENPGKPGCRKALSPAGRYNPMILTTTIYPTKTPQILKKFACLIPSDWQASPHCCLFA